MKRTSAKWQRILKGYTQYDLAAKTGWKVKQSEISLFERGLIHLSEKKIELLANALEIDKNKLSGV